MATSARRRNSRRARSRPRVRLAPAERRQQIVAAAATLLTKHGAAGVEIQAVAGLVGVTRPVVYRFFPTRLAIVEAVLQDFATELSDRFQRALVDSVGSGLPEIVAAFVMACCDAIEARGKGAWQLMSARGPDPDAARLGRAAQERMLAPWLPRIADLTGLSPQDVRLLCEIVVAGGGAALDSWLEGQRSRTEAVQLATRAVTALLREFSPARPDTPRKPRRRR